MRTSFLWGGGQDNGLFIVSEVEGRRMGSFEGIGSFALMLHGCFLLQQSWKTQLGKS